MINLFLSILHRMATDDHVFPRDLHRLRIKTETQVHCTLVHQGVQTRARQLISRAATIVRARSLSFNHESTTKRVFYALYTPKDAGAIVEGEGEGPGVWRYDSDAAKTSIVRGRSGSCRSR